MGDDLVAFVPLLVVMSIAAVPIAGQYFAFRRRKAALDVARELLQTRDNADERVIRELVQGRPPRRRDLRNGVLFIGLALAGFGFSFALEGGQERSILQAATLFPLVLGASYLAFHFLFDRSQGVE